MGILSKVISLFLSVCIISCLPKDDVLEKTEIEGQEIALGLIHRSFENLNNNLYEDGIPQGDTELIKYKVNQSKQCKIYDLVKIEKYLAGLRWIYHFKCKGVENSDIYVTLILNKIGGKKFRESGRRVEFGLPEYQPESRPAPPTPQPK